MNEKEYIIENIIWYLLIFIWCKGLFFRCLPDFSYFASLLVLFGVGVLGIGVGIAITWKWGRNYGSVVENIIMTWSLYVVITYLDIFKKRMLVITIVTIIISVLMTIMVMARRIKRMNKKKQIIRSRMRSAIALWRRNTVVASLVLLVPIAVSAIMSETVLNSSEVEVVEIYGDEYCLDANNAREKAEEDSLEYTELINEYLNKQSE